jgi:hypothetical protein
MQMRKDDQTNKSQDYPDNWKDIAKGRKDRADWACERCGHDHDIQTGHVLTVHHLDGRKWNNEWWNLPALCQRCHLRIQARVYMGQMFLFPAFHSEWFKPYLAGLIAHQLELERDESEVRKNVDKIIAIAAGE